MRNSWSLNEELAAVLVRAAAESLAAGTTIVTLNELLVALSEIVSKCKSPDKLRKVIKALVKGPEIPPSMAWGEEVYAALSRASARSTALGDVTLSTLVAANASEFERLGWQDGSTLLGLFGKRSRQWISTPMIVGIADAKLWDHNKGTNSVDVAVREQMQFMSPYRLGKMVNAWQQRSPETKRNEETT